MGKRLVLQLLICCAPAPLFASAISQQAVAAFNSCIFEKTKDAEISMKKAISDCSQQNQKEFQSAAITFTPANVTDREAMGVLEATDYEPRVAIYIAGNEIGKKCDSCLMSTSAMSLNSQLSSYVVATTLTNQGAKTGKTNSGPKPKCQFGFNFADGQCIKRCTDKTQVWVSTPERRGLSVAHCQSCDDYYKDNPPSSPKLAPLTAGRKSNETTNECLDKDGCTLTQEFNKKLQSCVDRCKDTEEFFVDTNYPNGGYCKKKSDGCETERDRKINGPFNQVPPFVKKFKEQGCNVEKHIQSYRIDFARAAVEHYKLCKAIEKGDYPPHVADHYETADGLAPALFDNCSADLGIRRSVLERKIELNWEEAHYPFPLGEDGEVSPLPVHVEPAGYGYGGMGVYQGMGGGMLPPDQVGAGEMKVNLPPPPTKKP